MILLTLILCNTSILVVLALFHFYWAAGGKWGIEYTIPDKFKMGYFQARNKPFVTAATLGVAMGLLFASLIVSSNYLNTTVLIPHSWTLWGTRMIGIIFILRAIGDFKICGIFKEKNDSKFARSDTRLFIPLCMLIGFSAILITSLT